MSSPKKLIPHTVFRISYTDSVDIVTPCGKRKSDSTSNNHKSAKSKRVNTKFNHSFVSRSNESIKPKALQSDDLTCYDTELHLNRLLGMFESAQKLFDQANETLRKAYQEARTISENVAYEGEIKKEVEESKDISDSSVVPETQFQNDGISAITQDLIVPETEETDDGLSEISEELIVPNTDDFNDGISGISKAF